MKVYRVHVVSRERENGDAGESKGYYYFANKLEAHAQSREGGKPFDEIDEIDVEISKQGILSALNLYGGHPDNG